MFIKMETMWNMEARISIAIHMLPSATKQQIQAVRESRNRNRDASWQMDWIIANYYLTIKGASRRAILFDCAIVWPTIIISEQRKLRAAWHKIIQCLTSRKKGTLIISPHKYPIIYPKPKHCNLLEAKKK